MKEGLDFKMVDGKVQISTSQTVDVEEFTRRIASIESKKTNFKMQIKYMEDQIEEHKKNIEMNTKNISIADEDLNDAYQFLRSNHREDVILQIEKKRQEIETQMQAQLAAAQQQPQM